MPENSEEILSQNDEQGEVVDLPNESQNNEFELVDDGQAEVVVQQEETETKVETETEKQSREDNHAARAARLKAEREASQKAAESARKAKEEVDERLAKSGAINPYTGKPFKSIEEFEDYGRKVKEAELNERSRQTGKSVEELNREDEDQEYIRKKRQEDSEAEAKRRQEEEQRQFFQDDLVDFMDKYPDVDVEKLDNNQRFRKFCGSRYGKEPLSELYESYIDLVNEAGKVAVAKSEVDTRSNRSTGSGGTGGVTLTAAQKRDLDRWNAENPEMSMTPKEFLSR